MVQRIAKRFLIVAAGIAVVGVFMYFAVGRKAPPKQPEIQHADGISSDPRFIEGYLYGKREGRIEGIQEAIQFQATGRVPDQFADEYEAVKLLHELAALVRNFHSEKRRFPGTLSEIGRGQQLDPWGGHLEYSATSSTYSIRSAGRDEAFGTADDIYVPR